MEIERNIHIVVSDQIQANKVFEVLRKNNEPVGEQDYSTRVVTDSNKYPYIRYYPGSEYWATSDNTYEAERTMGFIKFMESFSGQKEITSEDILLLLI